MSAITNGNDYKRGWEEGHSTALNGADKDYSGMGRSWKYLFHGDEALDTYTKGYNDGYSVGITEKNAVFKTESTNIASNILNNMEDSNAQSIIRELEALKGLNDYIVLVCDRLMQLNGYFTGYINNMEQTGVPVQQCETFRSEYYGKDAQNMREVYNQMTNNDIPRIRQYIEYTVEQFQSATGQSIGSINLKTPSQYASSTLPQGTIDRSGSVQDLEKQADAECDLMDFLVSQRDELLQVISDYKACCNELQESGVPIQYINDYVPNYAIPNISKLNNVIMQMQEGDYKFIHGLYEKLITSISTFGNSFSRSPRSM